MGKYYLTSEKRFLVKIVKDIAWEYNFITNKWNENFYWWDKIFVDSYTDFEEITEEQAQKIIKGERYAVN